MDIDEKSSQSNHEHKLGHHQKSSWCSLGVQQGNHENGKNVGMENCVIHVYGKFLCLKNNILFLRIVIEKKKGGNTSDFRLNLGPHN